MTANITGISSNYLLFAFDLNVATDQYFCSKRTSEHFEATLGSGIKLSKKKALKRKLYVPAKWSRYVTLDVTCLCMCVSVSPTVLKNYVLLSEGENVWLLQPGRNTQS